MLSQRQRDVSATNKVSNPTPTYQHQVSSPTNNMINININQSNNQGDEHINININ